MGSIGWVGLSLWLMSDRLSCLRWLARSVVPIAHAALPRRAVTTRTCCLSLSVRLVLPALLVNDLRGSSLCKCGILDIHELVEAGFQPFQLHVQFHVLVGKAMFTAVDAVPDTCTLRRTYGGCSTVQQQHAPQMSCEARYFSTAVYR